MKIYGGGTILTMENEQYTESVLVDHGEILATGSYQKVKSLAPDADYFDLQGKTMLPAFIDTHSHFSAAANALLQVPLDDLDSAEAICEKIQTHISQNHLPAGTWVIAKGYDQNLLPDQRNLPLALLDQIAPEHPLVIQHKSGHMGLFNSCAMRLLHVTTQTPVPDGGKIEAVDGQLTGYMEENAFMQYLRMVPMPAPAELLSAYEKIQRKYASYGITTIQEGMMVKDIVPLYEQLLSQDKLKLDLVAFPDIPDFDAVCRAFPQSLRAYHHHLKIGGIKIFFDGSPQGRTAWMRTPYLNDNNYCGYGTMTDKDVEDALKFAAAHKVQILAHCNGDAACAQYIRAIQKMVQSGIDFASLRPVMIHAQFLDIDQLPAVKKLGILPSFFVAHTYYWGDTHIRNFGYNRASRISPAHSAQHLELPFTFHQDTPVIEPDMMRTVWCAVNRKTKTGRSIGPEERIDVLQALQAVTSNAAYQYFEEQIKGSIRRGKRADFVILDQNPLLVNPKEICNIQVLQTIKNGEIIFTRN